MNENASLVQYEPPKCDECGRKIVVLSDLCAKCAAGIELNGEKQAELAAWRINFGNGFHSAWTDGKPSEKVLNHWVKQGRKLDFAYFHPAPAVAQGDTGQPEIVYRWNALDFSGYCYGSNPPDNLPERCKLTAFYKPAPAVAVNEKLKMALMMFLCAHDHPNANTTKEAVRCANEALGLIEAAKEGGV